MWVAHYGTPDLLICDLGGEFQSEWYDTCEEYGIDSRMAGSHAPWQNGFAERHGKILGIMWDKCCSQYQIAGKRMVKKVLAIIVSAKNATITRNGMTPEMAVFGRCLRWPNEQTRDDDEELLACLDTEGEAYMANVMRNAAKSHCYRRMRKTS